MNSDVELIEPGTVLSLPLAASIAASFSVFSGLTPDQFVVARNGLPVLPVPNVRCLSGPDWWPEVNEGDRRVPAGCSPLAATHPVFWIPDDAVIPRPGDTRDLWAARTYLEIAARDLVELVPEPETADTGFWYTAQWVNPVAGREDELVAWLAGEPSLWADTWRVETVPTGVTPDDTSRAFVAENADRIVDADTRRAEWLSANVAGWVDEFSGRLRRLMDRDSDLALAAMNQTSDGSFVDLADGFVDAAHGLADVWAHPASLVATDHDGFAGAVDLALLLDNDAEVYRALIAAATAGHVNETVEWSSKVVGEWRNRTLRTRAALTEAGHV